MGVESLSVECGKDIKVIDTFPNMNMRGIQIVANCTYFGATSIEIKIACPISGIRTVQDCLVQNFPFHTSLY